MNFLAYNRDLITAETVNKCTISQKVQKLYNDDSKELLMFYPAKLAAYEAIQPRLSVKGEEKFLDALREISEGPLLTYWAQMQVAK